MVLLLTGMLARVMLRELNLFRPQNLDELRATHRKDMLRREQEHKKKLQDAAAHIAKTQEVTARLGHDCRGSVWLYDLWNILLRCLALLAAHCRRNATSMRRSTCSG